MIKIIKYFKSNHFKDVVFPEIKTTSIVILFTAIYGIAVEWFLEQSAVPMYAGGMPGIGQVIRDILDRFTNISPKHSELIRVLFPVIANIPLLILAWSGVSKKFAIYSLISVVTYFLIAKFVPVPNLHISSPEHALLAAFLGGLVSGIGIGGTLKYGTSTGGVDIIAQYASINKGVSVGFISLTLNILIAFAGSIVTGDQVHNGYVFSAAVIFSYTMVRLILTTLAIDKVHTAYQYISAEIITNSPDQIIETILHKLGRGVTLSTVKGAYSNEERVKILVVISHYELQNMIDIINNFDEKAFIITRPVKNVHGNFKKKRIT